ncbi:hypothetical protein [Cupriavidus taiwanensis]|uniref:hypothetical protein n=1 Tax=Cupriavidus taiwanensis TaxID=164546 RepID=UPI000E2EE857|nr:hypothetical protein [Cupriavidus taiwanensis]
MNKKLVVTLGCAALLSACATSSQTFGPDGKAAHAINCSGSALTWSSCLAKAGDLCGTSGYNILDRVGEGYSVVGAGGGGLFGGSSYNRSMVVSCKA